MDLRIYDSHNFVDVDFGLWLINRIRVKLVSNISKYDLQVWDNFLNNSKELRRLYTKKYKTEDLIIFASNNLTCSGDSGEITISFNPNQFAPGFDRIRLNTLLKTINYGTLDTKGCSIFSDTFNYFSENIDQYVSLYYNF